MQEVESNVLYVSYGLLSYYNKSSQHKNELYYYYTDYFLIKSRHETKLYAISHRHTPASLAVNTISICTEHVENDLPSGKARELAIIPRQYPTV